MTPLHNPKIRLKNVNSYFQSNLLSSLRLVFRVMELVMVHSVLVLIACCLLVATAFIPDDILSTQLNRLSCFNLYQVHF